MRILLKKENQVFVKNLLNRDIQRGGRWHGRAATVNDTFRLFLKTVQTHLVRRQIAGGIDEPLVMLYAEPPSDHPDEWIVFRDHMQAQRVGSELTGYPEIYRQWVYCQLCHSRDHFVGLCHVQKFPGWKGPKSADVTEKRAPDRDQQRDRNRNAGPRGNAPQANYGRPGAQEQRMPNYAQGNGRANNRGRGRNQAFEYGYEEY